MKFKTYIIERERKDLFDIPSKFDVGDIVRIKKIPKDIVYNSKGNTNSPLIPFKEKMGEVARVVNSRKAVGGFIYLLWAMNGSSIQNKMNKFGVEFPEEDLEFIKRGGNPVETSWHIEGEEDEV
jgi:hypothetical protein